MSDTDPSKPSDPIGGLLEIFDAEEVTDKFDYNNPGGNPSISAWYSRSEIDAARTAAGSVLRLTEEVGHTLYELAMAVNEFNEKEYYIVLGFSSFAQFYAAHSYAESTIRKYLQVYQDLTLTRGIEVESYKSLDIGKIGGLLTIIAAGADNEQIEECLRFAKEVTVPDWRGLSKLAATNVRAGRNVWAETPPSESSAETDNLPSLESGYYLLEPVTGEEVGKSNPALNPKLKKLTGLKRSFYVDAKNGTAFMEVE